MLAWETWLYLWEGSTDWTEHSRSIKAQNFKKNEGIKKKKKNWETDGNWWYWCEVRSANARISGTTGNNIPHKSCRTWWKVLFLILLKRLWSVLCFQPSLCSWCCLCDSMDRSPPGSFVHGILQARVLERAAISSSEFLTQGLNMRLLHWQADSLQLRHLGSPPLRLPLPHSSNYLPCMLVLMVWQCIIFLKFYWSTVDLWWCVHFSCMAKYLSYTHTQHTHKYPFSYSFPWWFITEC